MVTLGQGAVYARRAALAEKRADQDFAAFSRRANMPEIRAS